MRIWVLMAAMLLMPTAIAADWEDYVRDGYRLTDETSIDGDYNGCDYRKTYPLRNGKSLICNGYSYSYSYSPDVLVLSKGYFDQIILVDGEEVDAEIGW